LNPFFSIIIPAYNREKLILATIQSVIDQTFADWECIVVDDGSTDGTREVVQGLLEEDSRIRYVYQKNAERSAARNNGIDHARGQYICFLDSDDFYLDSHLQQLWTKINSNETSLIITDYIESNNGQDKLITSKSMHEFESILEYVFLSGIIPARVCGNSSIFKKYKFDEDITIVEDSILWARIVQEFPILELKQATVKYSIHDSNSVNLNSKNAIKKLNGLKILKSRYKLIWKQLSLYDRLKLISDAKFKIAQSYFFENNRAKGIFWALSSLVTLVLGTNSKHRIYLLIGALFFIKNEYQRK
jgi:glycosyltransferase involved in cell wall biosynthesis